MAIYVPPEPQVGEFEKGEIRHAAGLQTDESGSAITTLAPNDGFGVASAPPKKGGRR
jgi:hypothetical protein